MQAQGTRPFTTPFRKRMWFLRQSADERDLYAMKSLHFEKLQGDRRHQRSIRLNDQYRLILAFETDEPRDFLDLVMELRGTQASRYTVRDTPIFTCVKKPIEEIVSQLF